MSRPRHRPLSLDTTRVHTGATTTAGVRNGDEMERSLNYMRVPCIPDNRQINEENGNALLRI